MGEPGHGGTFAPDPGRLERVQGSIASSLYAIYRHQTPSLPPVAEVYEQPAVGDMLQACNVTVRLWDELGDWEMDADRHKGKGEFVINPFSQNHPLFIKRFCELGFIKGEDEAVLQQAFARFPTGLRARQTSGRQILEGLRKHICGHIRALDRGLAPDARERLGLYVDLCKRVLEVGYVNRVGDIALGSPGTQKI